MKANVFVSPFFLTKLYLYRNIQRVLNLYSFDGKIMDIGCGVKPYKDLFHKSKAYEGVDYKLYSQNKEFDSQQPDYFFDKSYSTTLKLPFKDNSYNHSVAFQVLEHHPNPKKLISEMYRITRPKGYMFLTVPFMGGIHEEPYDFQRFTEYGLRELFKDYKCKIIEIHTIGSIFSTISMLLDEHLCDFVNQGGIKKYIGAIVYIPLFVFQYVCLILDLVFKSKKIIIDYSVVVQKI